MSEKKRKSEQIINAAARLFGSTHDFSKVSMEDIAKKAGVSPTTIYNNFGTRDNLVAETIRYFSLQSIEEYKTIIRSDLPFPEKIQTIMLRKLNTAGSLDWEMIDRITARDEKLAAFAADIQKNENVALLTELIRDGKNQGYISERRSEESILMYFQVLQASGSAFFRIVNAPGVTSEMADDLIRIMFYGLLEKGQD